MKTDTIAAIATPMTNSSIGIIRISGDDSLEIIEKVFKAKKKEKYERSSILYSALWLCI